MKKKLNIIFSVCFSILIITGIVKFTVGFKQLYYYDISKLNIEKMCGLSAEEIKLNYDYLIEYNLSKEESNFEMPTIKSSPQGKIHFEEVRDIFQTLNKVFNICLFISIIGTFINIKNKDISFLKITSISLISIPIILSLPIILNFQKSFVIFHELMFSNDYWIFDPKLDPVINMLPEQFFFHAGLMILGLILVSSMLVYCLYKWLIKKGVQ
ncbi:MAG: TIGR01906 family membrane protein [Romboutsia sp.]|uniref:TIGR01906 family membrane protein n=1 Tax=Romboutsia sp. TaxID=1965302 RepID=UPI003F2C2225